MIVLAFVGNGLSRNTVNVRSTFTAASLLITTDPKAAAASGLNVMVFVTPPKWVPLNAVPFCVSNKTVAPFVRLPERLT